MHLVHQPPASGTFTTPELERLATYRAAVAAGFYTDWDGSAATTDTDTEALAWLSSSDYLFTDAQRQRLDRLRLDVAAGQYADDRPPRPAPASEPKPEADATAEDPGR